MDIHDLVEILKELRSASIKIRENPTEESVKATIKKYDMLFVGNEFNVVYSNELAHSINKVFNISVSCLELNEVIPQACKMLNMHCDPMVAVSDINNPDRKIACYQITL